MASRVITVSLVIFLAALPDKPLGLKTSSTCNSISASWNPSPNATSPIIEYRVRFLDHNGTEFALLSVQPPGSTATYSNAKPGERYYIRVSARNNLGLGAHATAVVATSSCKYFTLKLGVVKLGCLRFLNKNINL